MIKTQQKLMELKGQHVYRRSINQCMMYERLVSEKSKELKMARQQSAEHIRASLDLANTLIGLVISEVGPANTRIALTELDSVNNATPENRRDRVNRLIAALTEMVNE